MKRRRTDDEKVVDVFLDFTNHVESCSFCVVVGCSPTSLCRRGITLWKRWLAQ